MKGFPHVFPQNIWRITEKTIAGTQQNPQNVSPSGSKVLQPIDELFFSPAIIVVDSVDG